jgi:hypothetical protein
VERKKTDEKACFGGDDGDGIFGFGEDWQQDRRTAARVRPLPMGPLIKEKEMKKLVLVAMMAMAFLASARTGSRIGGPLPECDPCPWVR